MFLTDYLKRMRPAEIVFWTFFIFNSMFFFIGVVLCYLIRRNIQQTNDYKEITKQYAKLFMLANKSLEHRMEVQHAEVGREIDDKVRQTVAQVKGEVAQEVAKAVKEVMTDRGSAPPA